MDDLTCTPKKRRRLSDLSSDENDDTHSPIFLHNNEFIPSQDSFLITDNEDETRPSQDSCLISDSEDLCDNGIRPSQDSFLISDSDHQNEIRSSQDSFLISDSDHQNEIRSSQDSFLVTDNDDNSNEETFVEHSASVPLSGLPNIGLPLILCSVDSNLKKAIKKDMKILNRPITTEEILNYDPEVWFRKRPKIVQNQFLGLIEASDPPSTKQIIDAVILIEKTYAARGKRRVYPYHLSLALCEYDSTHSKMVIENDNRPGGSYRYLKSFMKKLAQPITSPICNNKMIKIMFDNIQIVSRNWRILADNRVKSTVITSFLYMVLDGSYDLEDGSLCPKYWLFRMTEKEMMNFFEAELESSSSLLEKYYHYAEKLMLGDSLRFLHIDRDLKAIQIKIENALKTKTCIDEGCKNEASRKRCYCGGQLVSVPFETLTALKDLKHIFCPFESLQLHPTVTNITTKTGEPVMVNPSSYNNILQLLFHVKELKGEEQKRINLEVDAGIHTVVSEIIAKTYSCTVCGHVRHTKHFADKHVCREGGGPASMKRCFDFLVLTPGTLHIEMNICKGIIKLLWSPFVSKISQELKISSSKSSTSQAFTSDHHKTFDMLVTLYLTLTYCVEMAFLKWKGIVIPDAARIDPRDLHEWIQTIRNENIKFAYSLCRNVLYPILAFRAAVRLHDRKTFVAMKLAVFKLFFVQAHNKYHRVVGYDVLQFSAMPDEVKEEVLDSFSFSPTGRKEKCVGGDESIEILNKQIKDRWPKDIPDDGDWQTLYRTHDAMKKIRKNISDWGKRSDNDNVTMNEHKKSEQVLLAIMLFNKERYFDLPMENVPLHILGDQTSKLDPRMLDLAGLGEKNMRIYMRAYYEHFHASTETDIGTVLGPSDYIQIVGNDNSVEVDCDDLSESYEDSD